MTGWEWLTNGFNLNSAIQGGLAVTLIILFATDRILTRGQHQRRVNDIVTNHDKLIAEKDLRYQEMKESRDYYREARVTERDRADKVTEKLGEVVTEYAELTNHLLEALPRVGDTK